MSAFDDLIPKQPSVRVIQRTDADPMKPIDMQDKITGTVLTGEKIAGAQFDNANAPDSLRFARAKALRDDYDKLPAVAAYRASVPMYATALTTQPTAEGDLTLIKAYAKLTDPTTGVLNGEGQAVAGSGPYFERTVQSLRNNLDASGIFADRARIGLRQELTRLMKNRNRSYNQARTDFSTLAKNGGFDPAAVVLSHDGEPFRDTARMYEDSLKDDEPTGAGIVLAGGDAVTTTDKPPPEFQTRIKEYVAANKGRLDPQDFAAAFNFMAKESGFAGRIDPNSPQTKAELEALQNGADFGGVGPITRPMSEVEQGVNSVAQSGVGAGLIGAAQGFSMNGLDELIGATGGDGDLARASIEQTSESNPVMFGVGNLASGFALPFTKAAGVGRIAAEAGAYGAASGLGAGQGGFTDRLDDAAVGGVVGAGAGALGGKLLERFRKGQEGITGPLPADPAAVRYKTAIDNGITNPSLGQTKGGSAAGIERALENLPGSTGRFEDAITQRLAQTSEAVDNIAAKGGDGRSFVSRGDALIAGAEKWIAKAKGDRDIPGSTGVVGKAYDRIPISKDAPGELNETLGYLSQVNQRFADNPRLAAMMNNSKLSGYLDALAEKGLTFGSMKEFRSVIGAQMDEALIEGNGPMRSELRGLYGALTKDMKATASAQGPDALRKFEAANDLFKQVQDRIENTLVKVLGKTGDKPAESAAKLMDTYAKGNSGSADIRALAEIRKSIPKEEWGTVSSSVYRLMGQPMGSEGRDFSATTAMKNWNDMSPAARDIFFGKGEWRKEIERFNDVLGGMARMEAKGNPSGTARVAQLMAFVTGGAVAVTGQLASAGALGKLWQSPAFVKWATGYTKMVNGGGGVRGALAYSKRLDNFAKANPSLAQDAFSVRDDIKAFSEGNPDE